ncbi:MAG TPA: hypothetical protein VMW95_05840 [Desulfobacterales bacterium]|nr:hypothetical protein [Desulfobacterales bacterium]
MTEALSLDLVDRRYWGIRAYELKHEIQACGKHGETQRKKETSEKRYLGHYCNLNNLHLDCAIRYRNTQGEKMKRQYLEIIKANNSWGVYSQTYTLTEENRRWLDLYQVRAHNFLLDERRAIAKTINRVLAAKVNLRKIQPGFSILFHQASSENPFKQSAHFHVLILPMLANFKTGEIIKLDKILDHVLIKQIYKREHDKVLKKHGIQEFIEDEYVVHLKYVKIEDQSRINHAFRYNNRSQVQDLVKSIKKVTDDFESYFCLLPDKKEDVLIPHLKNREQILQALEMIFDPPIQIRMSYGFMRVLDKYSEILGIKYDPPEPEDQWEYLYSIIIRRVYKNIYNVERRKVLPVLMIYIRGPDDEDWQQIDPSELHGEWGSKGKGKFYKAIAR